MIQDDLAEERAFIEVLAHNLVEYTRMCQFSQTKKSPFEREAERYGMRYPGGKVSTVFVEQAERNRSDLSETLILVFSRFSFLAIPHILLPDRSTGLQVDDVAVCLALVKER